MIPMVAAPSSLRSTFGYAVLPRFAAASQNKAEEAQKSGYFGEEIVPVEVSARRGKIPFTGKMIFVSEHAKLVTETRHGTVYSILFCSRFFALKPCCISP